MEHLPNDNANSDHWLKYWIPMNAPSDDDWPEGLTEDGEKLFSRSFSKIG